LIREVTLEELVSQASRRSDLLLFLDTSALLAIGSGRPSLENLLETAEFKGIIVITDSVKRELEQLLQARGSSNSIKAKVALSLLESSETVFYLVKPSNTHYSSADDEIYMKALNLARRGYRIAVATLDKGLRRRLRQSGIAAIFLRRSENRFELEGYVE